MKLKVVEDGTTLQYKQECFAATVELVVQYDQLSCRSSPRATAAVELLTTTVVPMIVFHLLLAQTLFPSVGPLLFFCQTLVYLIV